MVWYFSPGKKYHTIYYIYIGMNSEEIRTITLRTDEGGRQPATENREEHHCLTASTNQRKEGATMSHLPYCDPLGARTQDPNIKSVVLYQLS